MQYIDIHHHIIHGVDDGPSDFEQTQKMLQRAHENGVAVIAATSHSMPGLQRFPMDEYLDHLKMAQEWIDGQGLGIRLCTGSEIFYTRDTVRMLQEGRVLTLNNTQTVLVEFNPSDEFKPIRDAVRHIGNAGYTVIVAHAERYEGTQDFDHLMELQQDYGAYIQINAGTIISPGGFLRKRWLRKLIDKGCCDIVATDAHNVTSRPCRMKHCYETLEAGWGRELAERLCYTTPAKLLELIP